MFIIKPAFLKAVTLCVLPHLFFYISAVSQTAQTISYTLNEGLPSNSVYRTLIDNRGFLWVATENGLARFDGKKFRTYTTADGLTDNEIIDVQTDNEGAIWVAPFRGNVCRYNINKDRFEGEETLPELKKVKWGNLYRPFRLRYGGMMFASTFQNIFLYRDNTITQVNAGNIKKAGNPLYFYEFKKGSFAVFCQYSICFIENDTFVKAIAYPPEIAEYISNAEAKGDIVYAGSGNVIIKYKVTGSGDLVPVVQKKYPFGIARFYVNSKNIAATSASGSTYLINDSSLEIKEEIFGPAGPRHVLQDYENNIWLSTFHKGLVKVQVKRISSYDLPDLKQNFSTLLKKSSLYAGGSNGTVYKYDGLYSIQKTGINNNAADNNVKKILPVGSNYFCAAQWGSFIFNSSGSIIKQFVMADNFASKTASIINDSVLITGTHSQVYLYNFISGKKTDSAIKRVVSTGVDKTGNYYVGSNDGLYWWHNKKLDSLQPVTGALSYRVNALCATEENLLWVGLATDSLIVLHEKKLVAKIPLGNIIPGNICKALYSSKQGEIWLGTNEGLNRINYTFSNNRFGYTNTYFGTADGLAGQEVNDISIENGIVYVATNNGISYLPENLQLPVSDIATFITGVYVNNQQLDLKDNYNLRYDENNITVNFSGVDLTGFIPLFESSLNGGAWQKTTIIEYKNLTPGKYSIQIRAVRRDGKPSSKTAAISFFITTPFWKNSLFWILAGVVIFGLILYMQQLRNKQKQKAAIEKITTEKRIAELEMQALKAQINPHFVFNCLNSIKGFIYDKNYLQADRYLDKFSDLMRSTVDNSDAAIISLQNEISYLDNYLQLEKLRFADKFSYNISVDESIKQADVYVPAMLLQPYVENAIRHGIRFLENRPGKIEITITQHAGFLQCSIDDNGIGREKAAKLKSSVHTEYQSKGMTISKRRAELYNIALDVIDKKDSAGNASGTTIVVSIPLQLKP